MRSRTGRPGRSSGDGTRARRQHRRGHHGVEPPSAGVVVVVDAGADMAGALVVGTVVDDDAGDVDGSVVVVGDEAAAPDSLTSSLASTSLTRCTVRSRLRNAPMTT